jgi:ketosteroid isomerase-like protein
VSGSNVEAIRAVYARWAEGDFSDLEIFDPDVRTKWADEIPDMRETQGIRGLASATRVWLERFDHFALAADSFHEDGDRVLVLLRALARHHGSDAELEWKTAHLWTMRNGKVVELEGWRDQEQGIRESQIRCDD